MSIPEEKWPDLVTMRKEMGLSQAELAIRLGVSPRTIQSCEQGWRKLGSAVEKSFILLYMSFKHGENLRQLACWEFRNCANDQRSRCLTHLSGLGFMCWFLMGNQCVKEKTNMKITTWEDKRKVCRSCTFFAQLLGEEPKGE